MLASAKFVPVQKLFDLGHRNLFPVLVESYMISADADRVSPLSKHAISLYKAAYDEAAHSDKAQDSFPFLLGPASFIQSSSLTCEQPYNLAFAEGGDEARRAASGFKSYLQNMKGKRLKKKVLSIADIRKRTGGIIPFTIKKDEKTEVS